MARTKTTKRTKNSEEDVPISLPLAQPGTPGSTTATVTDGGTPVSAYASTTLTQPCLEDTDNESDDSVFNKQEYRIPKLKRKTFKDDPMDTTDVKPVPSATFVAVPVKQETDTDDEIPIPPDKKPAAQKKNEAVDENADVEYPLGNVVKPGTVVNPYKNSNARRNQPVVYMIKNIKVKNFAVAHLGVLSYGFEEDGSPKPGFYNFVLETMVKDEDLDFFTSRNVGIQSLVQLVNSEGNVIAIPGTSVGGTDHMKNVTGVFFVTRFEQSDARINALFDGFLNTIQKSTWNGGTLNQKVHALTPEHFIPAPKGIGAFVGTGGCEQLITRFYSDFVPRKNWGKEHRDLLSSFWNPGLWTLSNAVHFGAPLSWLTEIERDKYAAHVAEQAAAAERAAVAEQAEEEVEDLDETGV